MHTRFSRLNRVVLVVHWRRWAGQVINLIGCSIDFLKSYIESLFKEGMNWDNWTKDGWHLDHIIPCSSFDLSNEEERRKCFHYSNLRPLWARDNWEKGSKKIGNE